MITVDNLKGLELELINNCNLKCPLCTRNKLKDYPKYKNNSYLEINKLISTLDQFSNLEFIHLVGNISEPLLYPNIVELLKYLKSRNIRCLLSTNGDIKVDWELLGTLLTKESEVRFCIDGSTQEIHEKYRVNSNLKNIIDNFNRFKLWSVCTKTLQFIEFSYNTKDIVNITEIKKNLGFDKLYIIPCDISYNDDFQPTHINKLKNRIRSKEPTSNIDIKCFVEEDKFIYLNCFGEYITCCDRYELYMNTKNCNIYENSVQEGLNEINKALANKYNDAVCKKVCNQFTWKLEEDRENRN